METERDKIPESGRDKILKTRNKIMEAGRDKSY